MTMSVTVAPMTPAELAALAPAPEDAGLGALCTERGNLPLDRIDVHAAVSGLLARTELAQGFRNPYDLPLEATYIFPLPARAAVVGMRMEADGRVVEAELRERAEARERYDRAIAEGRRASIAEEERPDVFTMRVGNILPGERVTVRLTMVGPLPYADGEATYRLPLVVAPRYIPGSALPGGQVGSGTVPDTDAVPDASRITPPVLLPGFPNPVRLAIAVDVDPAGLPLSGARSSLHAVTRQEGPAGTSLAIRPGERVDRDFLLRLAYGEQAAAATALAVSPDATPGTTPGGTAPAAAAASTAAGTTPGDTAASDTGAGGTPPADAAGSTAAGTAPGETASGATAPAAAAASTAAGAAAAGVEYGSGTFQLTVLPPVAQGLPRPRDVVLVLDRSGSMSGWKMVAARRAAARIVDTLGDADRFAVLTFDNYIDRPVGLGEGLSAGTDRNRYRAVEHLARVEARGGTELLPPLQQAAALLAEPGRDRVLVLVTDGQIGNEEEVLARLAPALHEVRVHTVGIDRAVNAGFLGRLAALGGGRCELVESEDRLDEAADRIHQRIGAPLVTGVRLAAEGIDLVPGSVSPARLPAIFPGVPLVVRGRWRGRPGGALVVSGTTAAGEPWRQRVPATPAGVGTLTPVWARAHLRDLEDAYAVGAPDGALERRIVAASLRFGVLCRFTAFVAVDSRVVAEGAELHRVVQPVELPSGWQPPAMPLMAGVAQPGRPAAVAFGRPAMAADSMVSPAAAGMLAPNVDMQNVDMQTADAAGSAAPAAPGVRAPWGFGMTQRARPAGGRGGGSSADVLAAARALAAAELRRLRAASSGPAAVESRRQAELVDLGSRLVALLQQLSGLAAEPELAPLRALSTALAGYGPANPPRGAELDALWQRAIEVLTAFAAAGPATPPATPAPGGRARGAFWKRS
jgi:Ca-activated chloride channel homolog